MGTNSRVKPRQFVANKWITYVRLWEDPTDLVRSSWIYKQLTRFRAGIEGCISRLKRVFGLDRCTWKGWEHFKQYVRASVVAYNLLVLARLLL